MINKMKKYLFLIIYYCFARYLPYQPIPGYRIGNYLRTSCCKRIFKKMGKKCTIKRNAYFGDGVNIEIGDYSQLGINCKVENDLILGKNVLMGPDVIIYSSSHEYIDCDIPVMFQRWEGKKESCGWR